MNSNINSVNYGSRRPIPISTIDWQSTNLSQMIPLKGIDFLSGVEQIFIQQTVALDDLLANHCCNNLFTIRVPRGETLFLANESSTDCQRTWFGSSRAFSLRLYDHSRQEALQIRRRLAFNCCLFGCYLQQVEVWIPPGEYLGMIKQNFTISSPTFTVINAVGNPIFHVISSSNTVVCMKKTKTEFKILNYDKTILLGTISHQWDEILVGYNLCVTFPGQTMDVEQKALILSAAFLLEYMFFESTNCCNCFI